ncbi:MAG: leucyl aminopeptidase [Thermomicrobiales bacterium]
MSAADFNPIPSREGFQTLTVRVASSAPDNAEAIGVPVAKAGAIPDLLGKDRAAVEALDFTGDAGQALRMPQPDGPTLVAIGVGDPDALDAAKMRDAAAALGRATARYTRLAVDLTRLSDMPADEAAQAVVEGIVLARYRYDALKSEPRAVVLSDLALVADSAHAETAFGAERGRVLAAAGALARDLANTPPAYLTARKLAEVATAIGAESGLEVEVFDNDALQALGCGGLLGVNRGSTEPARMVKLTYQPAGAKGHLGLVGKALTYDSGGISLKPSNPVHATMKNDMSGGGAVLAAMSALRDLGCTSKVTGWLMCTDNMPDGSAMALGDVLTIYGGKTVEVMNTDAEGRLIMADALVLATEDNVDAIVDIATLTGACLMALGPLTAGVLGNDEGLVDQVEAAARRTDERVWELPLDRRYRPWMDSDVADIKNLGGDFAGAITAALFLEEFVGDTPWAHLDIAGTAQVNADDSWRAQGGSGYGARLLADFAVNFTPPQG